MGANDMGCTGGKDKANADDDVPEQPKDTKSKTSTTAEADKPPAEAPVPVETASTPPEPAKKERVDNSQDFISDDLKLLMKDYFNRYDLDGSQTINSSEELKQLCTNLVVKLDLPMDVTDIDAVVNKAGIFQDDKVQPSDGSKGQEWSLEHFTDWFVKADNFKVDRN